MKQRYQFGTPKHIARQKRFRRRFSLMIGLLVVVAVASLVVVYDLRSGSGGPSAPISKTSIKPITFEGQLLKSKYFQFRDSGNWQFAASNSTDTKFIFLKYLGKSLVVQHQLIVYINQTPIPLDLASPRALATRVKDSKLEATDVSRPCGETYGKDELRKVRLQKIDQTTILCDPDTSLYRVLISQIGGDYNLKLRRSDGTLANYIIIYQNQKLNPNSDTLLQIAKSFEAL